MSAGGYKGWGWGWGGGGGGVGGLTINNNTASNC